MRRSRSFVVLLAALLAILSACGSSVTPQGDSGDANQPADATGVTDVANDTATIDGGGPCGPRPTEFCTYGSAGGICGDVDAPQVCENGAWRCPNGTVPNNQCSCFGPPPPHCNCTASGWQCPDAGVDAPTECPTDFSTANGTPCGEEGRVCGGPCTDRCEWCNVIRCEGGRWNALEVSPDPRCGSTFACGAMQCALLSQYCYVILDDTGGPNIYECRALPEECHGAASCACVAGSPAGGGCMQSTEGAVTVTVGGG